MKEIFNSNMDMLMRNKVETDNRIRATNNRINNLVLNAGGDSPNEVVDARLDAEGNAHDTLFDRLMVDYNVLLSKINNNDLSIKEINGKLDNINERLSELYGDVNGVLSVFVSENGDNENGDGTQSNPFRTIQRAVDSIPLIVSAQVIIWLESGRYLEDVLVRGINAQDIVIRSINSDVVNSQTGDTDVSVRSISFHDCPCYCLVRGITQTDTVNAVASSADSCTILFNRVAYGAVSNCRFSENTRNLEFAAVRYISCVGRTYDSHFSNQRIALFANFLSSVGIDTSTGSNNVTVINSGRSVVFASGLGVTGDTTASTWAAGQVFQ